MAKVAMKINEIKVFLAHDGQFDTTHLLCLGYSLNLGQKRKKVNKKPAFSLIIANWRAIRVEVV